MLDLDLQFTNLLGSCSCNSICHVSQSFLFTEFIHESHSLNFFPCLKVGVGMSMEGIEQNPVVHDLMSEMAFQHSPVDVKVM